MFLPDTVDVLFEQHKRLVGILGAQAFCAQDVIDTMCDGEGHQGKIAVFTAGSGVHCNKKWNGILNAQGGNGVKCTFQVHTAETLVIVSNRDATQF